MATPFPGIRLMCFVHIKSVGETKNASYSVSTFGRYRSKVSFNILVLGFKKCQLCCFAH